MADWCAAYPDPENMLDLLYHSASPANYGGYTNNEVDALLETARTEANPAQRLTLYQQAEDLIVSETASIPLVYPLAHVLVRPYIHNYQITPIPVIWPAWASIEREE
jgi:ABC-type oligopeptide transport system substrate-binding subunit